MKPNPTPFALKLGNRIKICLKGNKLTHEAAADRYNCSSKHISRITKGTTDAGVLMLHAMAADLGIPWKILVED